MNRSLRVVLLLIIIVAVGSGTVSAQEDDGPRAFRVTWSPDGRWIGVGSGVGAWIYDAANPLNPPLRFMEDSFVYVVAFDPVRPRIALAPQDGEQTTIIDLETGATVDTVPTPFSVEDGFSVFYDLTYNRDGSVLAVANTSVIYFINGDTGELMDDFTYRINGDYGYSNWFTSLAFSSVDPNLLAAVDWNGRLLTVALGETTKLESEIAVNDFGTEEIYAVPGGSDVVLRPGGELFYLEAESQSLAPLPVTIEGWLQAGAAHPDGRRLAFGSGQVWGLYDLAEQTVIGIYDTVIGDTEFLPTVYSLAFNPDGTRMVSVQTDGLLIIWDVETGVAETVFGAFVGGVSPRWG